MGCQGSSGREGGRALLEGGPAATLGLLARNRLHMPQPLECAECQDPGLSSPQPSSLTPAAGTEGMAFTLTLVPTPPPERTLIFHICLQMQWRRCKGVRP